MSTGFNNYFSNIGPDLASKITSSNYNFETYVKHAKSGFLHSNLLLPVMFTGFYLGFQLSSNKATGIDKISSKIIKLAAPVISDSLTLIFNLSITLYFPDEWKTAEVIPLYENGQRNIPRNYRPISVLLTINKIMDVSVIINLDFENSATQPLHY